jgi:hypothetical protein
MSLYPHSPQNTRDEPEKTSGGGFPSTIVYVKSLQEVVHKSVSLIFLFLFLFYFTFIVYVLLLIASKS